MRNQKGKASIASIILMIVLICVLIKLVNIYNRNDFNGFYKTATVHDTVKFVRDNNEKYSKEDSYKIENIDYNDSSICKEIKIEPNTTYKISCMVKTENVECEDLTADGGVSIGLMGTIEHCKTIVGTNDWHLMEFMFNSKNMEKAQVCFRIGGNENNCKGTVWFSNFKIEKGTKRADTHWKVGCFIIKNVDVNIEGKNYKLSTNSQNLENIRLNLERFKQDCYEFSDNQMTAEYKIFEINEPITSITYSNEHGYYFSSNDIKNIVYDTAQKEELDHIFVVCRMEDENGKISIPIKDNWIGLGGMDIYGIGYSLIRINKNGNSYTYKYGITNQAPEEVYIHEFLHTLERNNHEYGGNNPALHDYELYGYEKPYKKWYENYMQKRILNTSTNEYIGLDSYVYSSQPPHKGNFKYSIEVEFCKEPKNVIEKVKTMVTALKTVNQ